MPKIARILETCLYVDDLARAKDFYARHFDLSLLVLDDRMCAFAIGETVLLLFQRGAGTAPVRTQAGTIPSHDGHGPLHVAFAVAADDLPAWERKLEHAGIPVEGRMQWPLGGRSVYFRDPDSNLIELATPGLWANY